MPDHRLPVRLATGVGATGPDCVVVADTGARLAAPSGAVLVPFRAHRTGCACCAGRAPFAATLGRLFAERARGERPFFHRIVALSDAAGLQAAREALERDPLLSGRFRQEDTDPEPRADAASLRPPVHRRGGAA